MVDGNQEAKRGITPVMKDVTNVKKINQKAAVMVQPKALFHQQKEIVSDVRPYMSEPIGRKRRPRGDDRTLVEMAKGKKVLSSDARLHLKKLQLRNKTKMKENLKLRSGIDNEKELQLLQEERRILAKKIKKKREILRLQRELEDVSYGKFSSEYQIEEHDSS